MNEKTGLHPRNKHKSSYDFKELIASYPKLTPFVQKNKFNNESIDFSNPQAVIALNSALLKHFYNVGQWEIPKDYLCPPIPGRADYIHQIADLLTPSNGQTPKGPTIKMLDIGVGANCVYPLIANSEYGWSVVGTDIDETAVNNATKIVDNNKLSSDSKIVLQNVIGANDFYNIVVCNPPFHSSIEEARAGTEKKNRNLGLKKNVQNFGGQSNELWCEGGEVSFIMKMIQESVPFKNNVLWFSTMVSKSTTLPFIYDELKRLNAVSFKTIDLAQGQKKSRIVAWTFKVI
jgi:23S rRNA (adenine1618-N6)-methyltransferase